MPKVKTARPRRAVTLGWLLITWYLVGSAHLGAAPAPGEPVSVYDPTRTPVVTVPSDRWGDLQPVQLNSCNNCVIDDSTDVEAEPYDNPFFHEMDIEGNYLFTATGQGMKVWNIADPLAPTPSKGYWADASSLAPVWGFSDKNFFMTSISVPNGNPNIAVTGAEDFGLIVWNTTTKNGIRVHYQDSGVYVRNVYAAGIGTKDFAFVLDGKNLLVYDLTAASGYSGCLQSNGCPGVYKGIMDSGSSTAAHVSGTGNYVVYRNLTDVTIYNVSGIGSTLFVPVKLTGTLSGITSLGETEMWEYGGKVFLAIAVGNASRQGELRIYDVSCIQGAGTCTLPDPVVYSTPDGSNSVPPLNVDASFAANGKPYLYVGTSVIGVAAAPVCVAQREYFYDASDVAHMVDLTPKVPGKPYWGWYYEPCYGYNQMAPRHALLNGNVLYRSAFGFLDSHQLGGSACAEPLAAFNWTWSSGGTMPEALEEVAFTDLSTCQPDQWSWVFQDGEVVGETGSTSSAKNPTVIFQSAGDKIVSLVSTNGFGASETLVQTVSVAEPPNPNPVVESVTSDVTEVFVCSKVTFTANGVGGLAPLTYSWQTDLITPYTEIFLDGFESGSTSSWSSVLGVSALQGEPSPTSETKAAGRTESVRSPTLKVTSSPYVWEIPTDTVPGTYTATVTITNDVDPVGAEATSGLVMVLPLPPLALPNAPTADTASATVVFHVDAEGATEWLWDYGDGETSGWLTDPVDGPNPTHAYSTGGAYDVTVRVKNCKEGDTLPYTTRTITINVPDPIPLVINTFQAACPFGFCSFDVGESIIFTTSVVGQPELYEYDWTSPDGVFRNVEQSSPTPVTSHVYSAAGSYKPVLRIVRGVESTTKADGNTNTLDVAGGGSSGGLNILAFKASCPLGNCSFDVGASISFTTSVDGTPSSYQYDWNSPDGVFRNIVQSSTSPVTSHAYSAAGTYKPVLKVVNSTSSDTQADTNTSALSVGGASGSLNIIAFRATCPFGLCAWNVGESITFSTVVDGTPTTYQYDWNSPDGLFRNVVQSSSTPVSVHVYTTAGTYKPVLKVVNSTAQDVQADTNTSALSVSGSSPPPPPPPTGLTITTFQASCSFGFCNFSTGQSISFTVTVSGGTPDTYEYDWNSPDGVFRNVVESSSTPVTSHTYTTAGSYKPVLRVSQGSDSATQADGNSSNLTVN